MNVNILKGSKCFFWSEFSVPITQHIKSLRMSENYQPAFKYLRFLFGEKCVNMYVNHIVFTVLLMLFRQ